MERCRCDRIPQSIRFAPGRLPTHPCTNAICATNKRHLYTVRMPTYQSSLYDLKKLRSRTFEHQIREFGLSICLSSAARLEKWGVFFPIVRVTFAVSSHFFPIVRVTMTVLSDFYPIVKVTFAVFPHFFPIVRVTMTILSDFFQL